MASAGALPTLWGPAAMGPWVCPVLLRRHSEASLDETMALSRLLFGAYLPPRQPLAAVPRSHSGDPLQPRCEALRDKARVQRQRYWHRGYVIQSRFDGLPPRPSPCSDLGSKPWSTPSRAPWPLRFWLTGLIDLVSGFRREAIGGARWALKRIAVGKRLDFPHDGISDALEGNGARFTLDSCLSLA